MKVAIFGRGKVGAALHARALERAELSPTLSPSSDVPPRRDDADLVVLAVPDAYIARVAERLDRSFSQITPFVHCAGTAAAAIPLESGRPTGAMHPIVSFARPTETEVRGRTFSLRGHAEAVRAAGEFARALGAVPLRIEDAGPAYHAASAIAANGAVALTHLAVRILEHVGLDALDATLAMAGLLRSVADNVEALGVPAALTGPIARGDVEVVELHRAALDPEMRRAYDAVGRLVLRAAKARGLEASAARALEDLLGAD